MICVIAFVSWNHAWVNNSNQLFKYCYYDCGTTKSGGWYDRVYRVDPNYSCPRKVIF